MQDGLRLYEYLERLGEKEAIELGILRRDKRFHVLLNSDSVSPLLEHMRNEGIHRFTGEDWYLELNGEYFNKTIGNVNNLKTKGDIFKGKNVIINPFYRENENKCLGATDTQINCKNHLKLFIGSSSEAIEIAKTLRDKIRERANCKDLHLQVHTWQDVLSTGEYANDTTVESLIGTFELYDFGIFLFMPDDETISRSKSDYSVRDNVLFEFGLFVGKRGLKSCCIVAPGDIKLKPISDLDGRIQIRINKLMSCVEIVNNSTYSVKRTFEAELNSHIDTAAGQIVNILNKK